ncbi:MAG: proliferating cell nuclear antigen (pcna) [Candidatus Marinimicrobia bacterium]|nr:proliferating cell nuclear antigen (pcna) [Candidatus Neomarinimicrobiota bacterium]|tara:strand:+ start:130 stop:918 length:789 start_codon:yes stop_codon:yes gene_type:complete
MDDLNKFHLNIKTEQAGAFRILIEALKEILTEGNFIFDETGVKLMAMDSTRSILIHMKLDHENFEFFHCPKKMLVGVNMLNFFKLIKTMGNSETLTLFIEKENENKLGILINNFEKNSQTVYRLNLLDIADENIKIPPAEFETELSLPSNDFQKIIRDMINIGENIEIKSIGSQLLLNCTGDFASQETILGETNNGLKFNQISPKELPIQGIYSLKYLILFTKCTNLCNQINLYIKNDYPLIIRYSVASLGDIKLCLAPNSN